jgi:hypothetical protein
MKRLILVVPTLAVISIVFLAARVCRAAGGLVAAGPTEKSAAIVAIEQATGPSEAISAFSKALASGRVEAAVYSAFVRRMAQLGLPQAAYDQAQTAVGLDPTDKVSWAVIAFTQASTGKVAEALSSLARASPQAGDDPFVIRTAGQLLAWYDSVPDLAVADETKIAVEDIRRRLADSELFTETYRTTMEAFQLYRGTSPDTGGASAAPTGQEQVQAEPNVLPAPAENRTTVIYTQPYVVYSYPLGYPYPWYCSPFARWPGFRQIFITRRHLFDRDGHHDRDVRRPRDSDRLVTGRDGKVTENPPAGKVGRRVASIRGGKEDSLLASSRSDRTGIEASPDRRVPSPPTMTLRRGRDKDEDGKDRDDGRRDRSDRDRSPGGRRSR